MQRLRQRLMALVLASGWASATACDDLLTVSDPGRYTTEDLDNALEAAAAGVQGDLNAGFDNYVIASALLSDEWRHTGTWVTYEEFDRGRIRFGNSNESDNPYHAFLRARWAARDAAERFERVLGAQAAGRSPLMVQVRSVEAWADLLLAQGWCEAPLEAMGPPAPDAEVYRQAIAELGRALQLAQGAGLTHWVNLNRAGLARAHLLTGNYDEALTHARQVPNGWTHFAVFSDNTTRQHNTIVSSNTTGFNRAAGMREKWWPMVDVEAGLLIDPWTRERDSRVPIVYKGELGVNGRTRHYSQYKYRDRGADIPITHSAEMRLIEAEVLWRRGDLPGAMAVMNSLRAAVALSPLPPTTDASRVRDYLLHERFAQMFLEGQRLSDLHRFKLVSEMSVMVDDIQVFGPGRPTKFPMSREEAINTPGVQDDASVRCLPRA